MDEEESASAHQQNPRKGSSRTRAPLICTFCCRRFTRKEHLARHLRIHTQEKPFTCDSCGKGFSRMDILNRHAEIHAQRRPTNMTEGLSKRACVQCATSRMRCTREDPCSRCNSKGLRCVYRMPPTKKSNGVRESEAEFEDNPNSAHNMQALNEAIADPFDQSTLLYDENDNRDSLEPGLALNTNNQGQIYFSADVPYEPTLYETNQTEVFNPGFMPGINWVSPGQTILQEWGSQLAQITDNDVFPPMFNMVGIPEMPPPMITGNEMETPPRNFGRSAPGNAQLVCCADAESPSGNREPTSPEAFPDGLSSNTPGIETKYYAHGITSRAPFQRRWRNSQAIPDGSMSDISTPPSIISNNSSSAHHWLTPELYARVVLAIQEQTQTQTQIPPLEYFRLCVHLYFERLHPNFPFINRAAFPTTGAHWVLLTAVAGVGAAYLQSPLGTQWKTSLMEVVGKTLSNQLGVYQDIPPAANSMQSFEINVTMKLIDEIMPLLQAKILHVLFMLHTSSLYVARRAGFDRAELTQWCSYLNLVSASLDPPTLITGPADVQLWVCVQTRLRAGMMIWLLDSMIAYELNSNHLMNLGDTAKWLPCYEAAWEQPSIANIEFAQKHSISFTDAIDMIYIEKRIPIHLCEFSHVLLIHAIYRRTREVIDESHMRLSSWSPTCRMKAPISESDLIPEWPPSSTIASSWRNAACDSLDVLNWAANSKAAESCWEEPTVLYLHLSRLIILAPIAHFQTLAKFPSSQSLTVPSNQVYENARSQALQWAIRDQYKARLSVIHAGALLWHVRRFSTDNVIEPFGIYIATLLLWAYSVSTCAIRRSPGPPKSDQTSQDVDGGPDDSGDEPLWLRIDRPLDDELVQRYIRIGDKMSAHLKGVGDIAKRDASLKILKQGYYLLAGKKFGSGRMDTTTENLAEETKYCTWEIRRSYTATIQSLIEITKEL